MVNGSSARARVTRDMGRAPAIQANSFGGEPIVKIAREDHRHLGAIFAFLAGIPGLRIALPLG
jgi:hypothetical protein